MPKLAPDAPPEPPIALPPARTVHVPGRGELFLRDTGGDGPVGDAAARLDRQRRPELVRRLRRPRRRRLPGARDRPPRPRPRPATAGPVPARRLRRRRRRRAADARARPGDVVGYSMGGAIAQLIARDHRDVVGGLVLSGTAQHWQDAADAALSGDGRRSGWRCRSRRERSGARASARSASVTSPATAVAPVRVAAPLRRATSPRPAASSAGSTRARGCTPCRFPARSWSRPGMSAVPPHKQRELAAALRRARVRGSRSTTWSSSTGPAEYNPRAAGRRVAARPQGADRTRRL